jgi:hypothetical protein
MTSPSSPYEISEDATLEELQKIRFDWLEEAREQGVPEQLFQIAYWLGTLNPDSRGIFKSVTIGDVIVWASIKQELFSTSEQKWVTSRRLTIYHLEKLLVDWSWRYTTLDMTEEPVDLIEGSDLLFIPGPWVSLVMSECAHAESVRMEAINSATLTERDELAKRLLVGEEAKWFNDTLQRDHDEEVSTARRGY